MSARVLLVMGDWPNPSETFLMREMTALGRLGLDFEILATGHNRRARIPQEFSDLQRHVSFLPGVVSPAAVAGKTRAFCRHPVEYWRLGAGLIRSNGWRSGISWRLPAAMWSAGRLAGKGFTRVHGQFASLPGAVAWMLAQWLDLPFSFSCHARDLYVAPAGLHRLVSDAEFIVTCTEYNRRHLAERFPAFADKVQRVYHGVPAPEGMRDAPGSGVPLILAVGRLVEKKGFADLVEACSRLAKRGVDFRCEILGSGPLGPELARQSRRTELAGRVELVGWRDPDAVRARMSEAACLVAPSVIAADGDRDGIPNVILEAMAVGCPVVATEVSGIPEVVIDRQTGRLVRPNDPEALAGAIEDTLKNPGAARGMAENAYRLVREQFDSQRNAAPLKELLERT